ncbi:chorismate mutase [Patescibacteria group bacterium]|nr:chorismate mutase [Patescibacteria group bacterium]
MNQQLDDLRKQIDVLDEKILISIAKRVNIVRKIGKYKKERKLSVFDKKRWDQILKSNLEKGRKLNLSEEFIKNLLNLIHKYSLDIQEKINNEHD